MKELKVSEENVLKAADKCPQAKVVLRELFPEVFENEEVFCYSDSIFKCRHTSYIYTIVRHRCSFFMYNLTQARTWSNYIDANIVQDRHYKLGYPNSKGLPITKGEFLDLVRGTTSNRLDNWKIVF